MADSEEEALCRNYPYALYFVQSPSTVSHANSADLGRPTALAAAANNPNNADYSPPRSEPAARPPLSRYSSRGSNNTFSRHEKKVSFDDDFHSNGTGVAENAAENRAGAGAGVERRCGEDEDGEEDFDEYYYGRRGGWKRFLSMGYSDSGAWMFMQIAWRLVLSMALALVVFYIATKPPPPKVSVRIVGIRQWGLEEGVDATGVTTKMLSCNCSIDLIIDNKSKLFGLHTHPPLTSMYFGRLPFATSQLGGELYAGSSGTTLFKLTVGTRNKPMYGAGRAMQDMLDSGKGLPVVVRVRFVSWFRVVWGLIRPKFHHQADCLVVLSKSYNKKRRTQVFNSTCVIL
nr:uncharacterized protein LOC109181281 [Ipomoea batatas]